MSNDAILNVPLILLLMASLFLDVPNYEPLAVFLSKGFMHSFLGFISVQSNLGLIEKNLSPDYSISF